MKKILICFIFLLLVGCTNNPYKKYYKSYNFYKEEPLKDKKDIRIEKTSIPLTETDIEKFLFEKERNGYVALGFSAFREESVSENKIKRFAAEIGANLVVYSKTYLGKHSYETVISMPVYSTTTSSGSIYNYDYGNSYYTGTSTTTSTQYIPITETMYIYGYESIFFKKLTEEEIGYGMLICDIEDIRDNFKIPKDITEGIVVFNVFKGSQAYKDGFLARDIIVKIDEKKILNQYSLEELDFLSQKEKRIVEVLRNGKIKKIIIK